MATIKKVLSGKRAKINGNNFEEILKQSAYRKKWDVEHFPPLGAACVGPGKFKTQRMPFDMIFSKNGRSIFVDAKYLENETSFSYGKIKTHQLLSLLGKEQAGCPAGYIVQFKKLNQTILFRASALYALTPRQSLQPTDGLLIGNNTEIDLDLIMWGF